MAKKDDIIHEALKLPTQERASVIYELVRSIEPEPVASPADVAAAWEREILARVDAYRSGGTETVDAFKELDKLEREGAGQPPKK